MVPDSADAKPGYHLPVCQKLSGVTNNYILKPITSSDSFIKSPNTGLIVDYRVIAHEPEFYMLIIV